MIIAPMTGEMQMEKSRAFNQSMNEWNDFVQVMNPNQSLKPGLSLLYRVSLPRYDT